MKLKNKKRIEKIINFLLNVLIFIFGLIFLISIYTGVQTKILGNKYTNFFGYSLFEVQTGSMEDTINPGDWIIVKLTQNVKLDDIITYELNGEYITHRVIEVYNGTYVTKGDANNAKDQPVDQKQIVGKVVNILAGFGILRKTLFNPSVLIALIITLFLFNMAIKKKNEKFDKSKIIQFIKKYKIDKYINKIIEKLKIFYNKTIEKYVNIIVEKLKFFYNKAIKKYVNLIIEKLKIFIKYIKNLKNNKIIIESESKEDNLKNDESKKYDFSQYDDEDDDDLGKTSLYRVISIDGADVDEKYKDEVDTTSIVEHKEETEDLDKTSLYRVVSVDLSELDDTFLEIAKNEINKDEKTEKTPEIKDVEEPEEEPDENLIKIDLDLLKNKRGNKNSNAIEIAMLIKQEEINTLIAILLDQEKLRANEATIREIFINTYIDVKYYNFYSEYDIENSRSLNLKIERSLKKISEKLIKNYKGKNTKYDDIVNEYYKTFDLITNLEKAEKSIDETKIKSEFYKKEITKYAKDWNASKIEYVSKKIIEIQKKYNNMIEYYLKKLETNMFDLNFNKLSTVKDMYGLELKHNLSFSKVYSEYVIDKTYSEGIIAEDKMMVLLTLLSEQLVKDMISSDFDKKYILYIPDSLYNKEKKFEKLLKMIDNKYAKDNTVILVTFENLTNNKQIIKRFRKEGYKFALGFNKEIVIKNKDIKNLYIVNYMFIDKKDSNLYSIIPKDLSNNIINENIVDKIGDFGSDEE